MTSGRSRARLVLATATCSLLAAMLSVIVARPATAASPTNVLLAGHKLVAGTRSDQLSSRGGEFELDLDGDNLTLRQYAPLTGPRGSTTTETDLWFRDDPTGKHQSSRDHTVLALKRNGNLVLRTSKGYVLWSSHTGGTGEHNRLLLRENGNLAIYTARNRQVWSSGTTAVLLPAGRKLRSGGRVRSVFDDQLGGPAYQLIMQRSGDLQYRCRTHVLWHTHTSIRGSFAQLRRDGNFVVYSPSKKVLWSTHTLPGAVPTPFSTPHE